MLSYRKPYFAGYLASTSPAGAKRRGRKKPAPVYPYSRAMLKKYDVFDLFILDGGAFFFMQEHLGGGDGARCLDAYKSGKLLAPWKRRGRKKTGGVAHLDWMACYDDDRPGGYWHQTVEQHVWLHRLYWLLPMAQEYLRTGRARWAREWFSCFKAWVEAHPEPKVRRPESQSLRYIWGDMQQAWRLLVMIHSIAMFGGTPKVFTPSQWALIYRTLESHARRLVKEARRQIVKGGGGNHFLQKGMVLVSLGTLFPELEGSAYMVSLGRRVTRWHLIRRTFKDGGSIEASPSYSHFISRLYLDTYLLLKANRRAPVKGLRKSLAAQYRFLAQTATPHWKSLQTGDSYALDALRDFEIVDKVFPVHIPNRKKSVCFAASQFVVLRGGRTAVYIDAMKETRGHIHAAKPQVLAYHRGRPVLIDSGCVNYDDAPLRYGYLKKREAHNVVVVAPVRDDEFLQKTNGCDLECCDLTSRGGSAVAVHRYGGEGVKYVWRRAVSLDGDTLEITDTLTARKPMRCTLFFHLADGAVRRRGSAVTVRRDGWRLACECRSAAGRPVKPHVTRRPAVDVTNNVFKAPQVSFRQSGRKVVFTTVMRLEE